MYNIYLYSLIIGLSLLILSLVLDGVSDLFQGLSLFDIHFDFLPGILPLSPLQFCAFAVGFGSIGITLYYVTSLHFIFSVGLGLILSYSTHKLLSKLRSINSETITPLDIIGCEGKVVVTIFNNGIGSVSLNTKNGKITYCAKSDHYIKQGTIVKILDIQNSILIVSDAPIYFLTTKDLNK